MKKTIVIFLILAGLVGGAAWYGFNHGPVNRGPSPEVLQKIELANRFVENGDAEKAYAAIDELLTEGHAIGQEGEKVFLKALDRSGRHSRAVTEAEEYLEAYPEATDRDEVELIRLTGQLAASGLSNPQLRKSVEDFLAEHPDHPGAVRLHIALAEQEISLKDYAAAQRRLARIINSTTDDEMILQLAAPLGEVNLEELYSPALGEGDINYTVERGDTINGIANKHDLTEELVMRVNNIDNPRLLRVGQKLKIPNVNWSVEVDISANTLTLKNHGEIFKIYPVRTGRVAGSTPTGEFKILNKKRNPTWRPGNGYAYLPGDPNNELGTRWMAFEGDILGIHGTVHPNTVGEYASNGCVGMHKEDVEELFNLITVGTPLTIKGQQDLTRHKIIEAPSVPPPQEVAKN